MDQILQRIVAQRWLFAGLALILVGILVEQGVHDGWLHWLGFGLMLTGLFVNSRVLRARRDQLPASARRRTPIMAYAIVGARS